MFSLKLYVFSHHLNTCLVNLYCMLSLILSVFIHHLNIYSVTCYICSVSTYLHSVSFNSYSVSFLLSCTLLSHLQKQPPRGILEKRCSENMQQIYRRTPMPKCDFNKVTKQLYWNYISAWVFSCKFAAYF